MNFVINFIKGIFIGIGAIAPGVSGGSLAVIFGIYEKLTGLVSELFKDFKRNFFFFLPIGLGGAVGVLGFSKIMKVLFENYNAQVKYLFIGLIVGTFPFVFNQANSKGFKRIYLFPLLASLVLTIFVSFMDNHAVAMIHSDNPGLILLILYGAILGFGTIIPGISSSFILMYLGAYETILGSIANVNLSVLIPTGIGFVLSIVIFAKLINLLFKKAYGYTYYTIIGFVIGSIVPIFPGFAFSIQYFICMFLMIIGFGISFSLSKIKNHN